MSNKTIKQPGGFDASKGPTSKRGQVAKPIPGAKPIKMTEKSRGWEGKKG